MPLIYFVCIATIFWSIVLQWVAGFVSFLYPMIQAPLRAAILPIHVYFGTAGFITTIAACLIGLTEKALFVLNKPWVHK